MARPAGTRNINIQDIIGKEYNGLKVLSYEFDKERIRKDNSVQRTPFYKCKCISCGKEFIKNRQQIKACGCQKCSAIGRGKGKKISKEQIENTVKNMIESNKTCAKSGLKYYCTQIDSITGKTLHKCKVGFTVNGKVKTFNVYSGINKQRAIMLAQNAHKIISKDNKMHDNFLQWYKEVKAENANL